MSRCNFCREELDANYCGHCGRPYTLRRIDKDYVLQELQGVFSFDKGYLYTIKELIKQPRQSIRDFLLNDRNRLAKPIFFLFFCTLIFEKKCAKI